MKTKIINTAAALLLLIVSACSRKSLAPVDYAIHFSNPDNGLVREKIEGPLHFQAMFINKTVLAVKRSLGDKQKIRQYENETDDLTYITLTILSDAHKDPFYAGISDMQLYSRRVQHANTLISKDFSLMYNGKSYECRYVVFEPTHHISHAVTFSLVFDKVEPATRFSSDITLVYDDKLYGLGPMKFNFSKESLNNIPDLNL